MRSATLARWTIAALALGAPLEAQGAPDWIVRDAEALRSALEATRMAKSATTIRVARGLYRFRRPFRIPASAHRLTIACEAGTIFDGSIDVDPLAFKIVPELERPRLAPTAREAVVVQKLEDAALLQYLTKHPDAMLLVGGALLAPARFPNKGDAGLAKRAVEAEISPPAIPAGKEKHGVRAGCPPYQVAGRARGWRGSAREARGAWVSIAARNEERAGSWQQWQDEVARLARFAHPGRVRITGFLDADWLRATQSIVAVDAERRAFHLAKALAYGWAWKNKQKPFHITGLLCELDRPGEWHFDVVSKKLYLWPQRPLSKDTKISVPIARDAFDLRACSGVTIYGLEVRHLGAGCAFRLAGRSNTVAACRIHSSLARGVEVTGQDNRVLACELFDLAGHAALGGGRRTRDSLALGRNTIENCHIYQRSFRDTHSIRVSITGAGNRFRHNLVHNSLGQAVVVRGNAQLLEYNELFHIGFREGDGGAIYSGADLAGYGNTYRYNFLHHLIHVPGKVQRAGIHLDDLQAGSVCIGNVFFKSAEKGIFMFGGAGHVLRDNLFCAGRFGILNDAPWSERYHTLEVAARRAPPPGFAGSKEDFVGRVTRALGADAWLTEPWRSRFPRFGRVMREVGRFGRLWPIHCVARNNLYCGNERDETVFRRVPPEAMAKNTIRGDRVLRPADFVDYAKLDFRLREKRWRWPVRFEAIGLRRSRWRRDLPDPRVYRPALARAFAKTSSFEGAILDIDSAELVAPSRGANTK